MNSKDIIIIAVVIVLVGGIAVVGALLSQQEGPSSTPDIERVVEPDATEGIVSPSPSPPDDTTEAINQELEDIEIGDLDNEFLDIDADLESL